MNLYVLFFILCLSSGLNYCAIIPAERNRHDAVNDGPYIFKKKKGFKIRWIENDRLRTDHVTPENFILFKDKFNLKFNYEDLKETWLNESDHDQNYNGVDSIGILSDVHGEFRIYSELLQAMGIVDSNLNWNFGEGHLVILGDVFDRGNMVTEVLWHLFGLEKQARQAGGMVHMMLGNHEVMILQGDLEYISEKYTRVEAISGRSYNALFAENYVLGKWLRSRPVVITINNMIFIHGGISEELIHRKLTFNYINKVFSQNLAGRKKQSLNKKKEWLFLNSDLGPVWYRGYFNDIKFNESTADAILNFYGKDHIVVGHTINPGITSIFNNKILGIDTGITNRKQGEMLMYKNGAFYIGLLNGERLLLYYQD